MSKRGDNSLQAADFPIEMPRKRGRRSKLTPKRQEAICNLIREGAYAVVAAQCVGISESSFYFWKQRGRADLDAGEPSKYSEFLEALKKAESEAEVDAIKCVLDAAKNGSWTAAMTYLERRWPKRWSRSEKREHIGAVVEPVATDLSRLTVEELKLARDLAAKVQGGRPTHSGD